jgi:hypothetical protein
MTGNILAIHQVAPVSSAAKEERFEAGPPNKRAQNCVASHRILA